MGDRTAGLACLEQAIDVAQKQGNSRMLFHLLIELGNENAESYPERALDLHKRALSVASELGGGCFEAEALCNLGGDYCRLGQYADAQGLLERGLQRIGQDGDRRLMGVLLFNLGEAHKGLGGMAKASEYARAGIAMVEETDGRLASELKEQASRWECIT